jgi:hypothetical protein
LAHNKFSSGNKTHNRPTRSLAHRLCSFTHAQARHVFRRAQSRSPAGRACTPTTRPLSGDLAAFLELVRKRISFFTDMRLLPALACPILLLGRADASRPRVHRGGRNWLVAQDLIGACHMHTCVHKKIPRHMKLCAHTRNTTNSPDKSAFSASLQRQRDASFAHCQGHNGWRLACRMHVYAGGSDHVFSNNALPS